MPIWRCRTSRRHSFLSVLWIPGKSQGRCLCAGSWELGSCGCIAPIRRDGLENYGYERRGALTYLAGFVMGVVFLEFDPYRSNSFIRFHAFQSILFNVAWVGFWIIWMILSAVLTPLTAGVFGLIALPLMLIFTLAGFGIWIFLMYQAYQQKLFKLPIVGRFAAEHAGVRL